jgi:tetratricopeptide (TPR) repeat protein
MRGDWKDAGPHFKRATELKSENPESHNNLGLYYSQLARQNHDPALLQKAIDEYSKAVNIKDDTNMRANLANAYMEVKNFPEAIENYLRALKLNPNNPSAHCNLGYALMQPEMGKLDDAIQEFMKALEIDPTMQQASHDLEAALKLKGINPAAPAVTGTYNFDANKALQLLRSVPPGSPQQ